MTKKLIAVIELPEFQKFAKRYLSESECIEIINHIAANPTEGEVIKGSGGIRKLRFALSNNKGKSGGMRVIYFYHNDNMPVFLITGFSKSETANISKAACNELKTLTQALTKIYERK